MKFIVLVVGFVFVSKNAFAMHITEGFLSVGWALFWFVVSLPFVIGAIWSIKKKMKDDTEAKMLFVFAIAFVLFVTSLKLPSIMGSSSHPTGIGLGVLLFGPFTMSIAALIVLFLQAVVVAHGGLSTLGANVFSLGIMAPFLSYMIYLVLSRKIRVPNRGVVFLTAFFCDIITYAVTSLQLGLAYPDSITGSFITSSIKFMSVFLITQIPIAIAEGFLTVFIFDLLVKYKGRDILVINKTLLSNYSVSLKKMLLVSFAAIAIAVAPYFVIDKKAFERGTDDLATDVALSIDKDYTAWFDYIVDVPKSIEGTIFLGLGIIGISFIAFYLRRNSSRIHSKDDGIRDDSKQKRE